MNTKPLMLLLGLGALLCVGLAGCKQEPEAKPSQAVETDVKETAVAAQEGEQTTCPVMGGAIDKAIFVEYQGKKVYFCCEPCKGKFNEAPETYLAKLPQFSQAAQTE